MHFIRWCSYHKRFLTPVDKFMQQIINYLALCIWKINQLHRKPLAWLMLKVSKFYLLYKHKVFPLSWFQQLAHTCIFSVGNRWLKASWAMQIFTLLFLCVVSDLEVSKIYLPASLWSVSLYWLFHLRALTTSMLICKCTYKGKAIMDVSHSAKNA